MIWLIWGFCDYSLLQMVGFGACWRNWVRECVSSAYFSVMIGSPIGFFVDSGRETLFLHCCLFLWLRH